MHSLERVALIPAGQVKNTPFAVEKVEATRKARISTMAHTSSRLVTIHRAINSWRY